MQSLPEFIETESSADSMVNDYLDRVCAPLAEHVPYAHRMELRLEMLSHLESSIAAHRELGVSLEAAVRGAMEQFGEPSVIGRRLLREAAAPRGIQRLSHTVTGWLSALSGAAVGMAASIPLMIITKSATADHSEFWIGGFLGVVIGLSCWKGRRGPIGGFLRGAATGVGIVAAIVSFNLLMIPNYIELILSDWRSLLVGTLQFAATGAAAGALIGSLCRFWRRFERSPRPWVPA